MMRFVTLALWLIALAPAVLGAEPTIIGPDRLVAPTGGSWYRFQNRDGKPIGFARLDFSKPSENVWRIDWRVGLNIGAVELQERQRIDIDTATFTPRYHRFETGGKVLEGRLVDGEWRVTGVREKTIAFTKDAWVNLVLVLAPAMPLKPDLEFRRQMFDARRVYARLGTVRIVSRATVKIDLDGVDIDCIRYDVITPDGRKNYVWVDAFRSVVRADLPGGIRMLRSKTNTESLFVKKGPALTEVKGATNRLELVGRLPNLTPAQAFEHWTKPALLAKWWVPKADVGAGVGEKYVLEWPRMKRTLRSEITAWKRGARLGFTWRWDHLPDATTYRVDVRFEAHASGGTTIRIVHGEYPATEAGGKDRAGHREGWQQFVAVLRGLPTPD